MTKTDLPPPDPIELAGELAKAYTGKNYTPLDRFKDFRQLFLGSEQGRRVLWQILAWGHMFASSTALAQHDSNKTFTLEGERNIALRIFAAIHQEPKPLPTRANTRKEQVNAQESA